MPVFDAEVMTLLKRLMLVVNDGWIEKVFYSVFPPNENAEGVIEWLWQNLLEAVSTPR